MSSQVIFYVEAWLQCKVTIKYISAKKEKLRKKKEARKRARKGSKKTERMKVFCLKIVALFTEKCPSRKLRKNESQQSP